jgi:DNA-binding XRE family transcriptional regulator
MRKPDLARRVLAQKLRQQGLTHKQIAARLRITRQGAAHLLKPLRKQSVTHCRTCGIVITDGEPALDSVGCLPFCLTCLAKMPQVSFGERLLAWRLSRGLTRQQLAEATGVASHTIRLYEWGKKNKPHRETVVKLARVLGSILTGQGH